MRVAVGWGAALAALMGACLWFAWKLTDIAGAFFTGAASVAGVALLWLTYRLWLVAAQQREDLARQNEVQLMLTLMVEYDNLRDSIEFIHAYFIECASSGPTDPVEHFKSQMDVVGFFTEDATTLNKHRFRVSRFFVRTRKLCQAEYLNERLVAMALGGQAIEEVFLGMVDPLDEAKAGANYGSADRRSYQALLAKYPRPAKGLTK